MPKYTGCPACGKTVLDMAPLCPHCGVQLIEGAPPPRAVGAGRWFCTQCGTVGSRRTITKGSFLVEVVLWLLLIVPGLIYSLWRLSSRYQGCRHCGAPNMIPVSSPIAQAALHARHPTP